MPGDFEARVADAVAEPTEGRNLSWFAGRVTEQRPSWGYQRPWGNRGTDPRDV
ncbi:hypothetical protein [Nocardiopsis sp. MG754419]|uniref:hypothetical protein n=1 Tax=Nocardiopsis sp. MG754419 TaxID=2259865 RepID=UPI0020125A05|nr:hypothetical protein [Nocardiopsis sp. MG754419]